MNWLKQVVAGLVLGLLWLSTTLPASANFIQDGGFINDMEILMKGKPGSELAVKLVNENMVDWVTLGKNYCTERRGGLSQEAILRAEWDAIPESTNPDVSQAIVLATKTMARVAKMTYCPEYS